MTEDAGAEVMGHVALAQAEVERAATALRDARRELRVLVAEAVDIYAVPQGAVAMALGVSRETVRQMTELGRGDSARQMARIAHAQERAEVARRRVGKRS